MQRDAYKMALARLDDLRKRAERTEIIASGFMSPSELRVSCEYLNSVGAFGRYFCFGGYPDAERKRIFFLPDYISEPQCYEDLLPYIENEPTVALLIKGSGYRRLSHRDILGSLLSLGIERDVVGDIAFIDDSGFSAVVFCDAVISEFILSALDRVANDAVRIKRFEVDDTFVPYRSFLHILRHSFRRGRIR